ncbi:MULTISPECIES: hydroxymethylbilane synthase [unclassified Helicobacter]|uniref:hydroxymethylbilane synthase n=1 Tax=unclassified Helicobacter TaxID=2593540 RepID=UPI000CF0B625|nr:MULTISPECIES: hydroxymethylbilane synthase [unclassified Helicobacter]
MREVVIGTRGSLLALWQANHIKERLRLELGIDARLEIVKTKGDKILDVPLAKIGGKGLFTKELEELLLQNKIDLAVHSLKDVPVDFVDGLGLVCITKREDPRDCFLSIKYPSIRDLPMNAKVGTTSLRRSMQLKYLREDLDTQSLRGNVQTRLKRLIDGDFDAIILAKAGLNRLEISSNQIPFIKVLETSEMIPAMGQGALGIEARLDDALLTSLKKLNDQETAICTRAERAFIRTLEGGCQVPIGVYAQTEQEKIKITAILGLPNGKRILRDFIEGNKHNAENLGIELAQRLIQKGARDILYEAQQIAFI